MIKLCRRVQVLHHGAEPQHVLAAFVHARLLAGGMTEPAAVEFMTQRFTRFLQVCRGLLTLYN